MAVEVKEDEIVVASDSGKFILAALGGPDEDISITGRGDVELTPEDRNELQLALLNFGNTGYFNQEA